MRPPCVGCESAGTAGTLEFDRTRLKTNRSIGLIESAFFRSPKLRWKVRTEETALQYTAGDFPVVAAVRRIARIPMMAALRLTPIKTAHKGH